MIAKFRLTPGLAAAFTLALALPAGAQNLLQNGGFEDIAAPAMGHFLVDYDGGNYSQIAPWKGLSIQVLQGSAGITSGHLRLHRVDGPGGFVDGPGGLQSNYSEPFPAGDASGAAPGVVRQYLSTDTPYGVWQTFTAPCSGVLEGHARVARNIFTQGANSGRIGIEPVPGGIPPLPVYGGRPGASQQAHQMYVALQYDPDSGQYVLDPDWSVDEWHEITFSKAVTAGQEYALVAQLQKGANLDEVSVTYAPSDTALECVGSVGTPIGGLPNGPDSPSGPVGPTGDPADPDNPDGRGDPNTPTDPDKPDLPEAKQIFLKKACEAPVAATQNGQSGVAWRCEVTVAAIPAPFAGTFQFTEDASAITGASGQITGVAASPGWTCPGLPAAQTNCTIQGADFDASGVETLSFDLFAPATGPVGWKNCVNGLYAANDGKREVRGNCDGMEWKPEKPRDDPKPEKADISKTCEGPREVREGATLKALEWECRVAVDVAPAPFAGSFAFFEDASQITGAPGTISNVAASPGWNCTPPAGPATPQMLCSINGADFSPSGQEVLTFTMTADMTGNAGVPVEWKNCVSGATDPAAGPRKVSDCAEMTWKPEKPKDPAPEKTGISKTCTEPTEQRHNGTLWGLGWECDVTVTVNPAPFSGSFSFLEDASGVIGASGAQIISVNAGPGWACTPAPGGGQDQTTCTIAGADFPASGSDTLHFELFADMANVPEQAVIWENCVSGATSPAANPREVADCVTTNWTPPALPAPELEITKTCDDPVPAGTTGWDVSCTVTVTGANLQPGLEITLYDMLTGMNGAAPQSGTLSAPAGLPGGVQCGGSTGIGMVQQNCTVSTDDLMAAGGTLSFPYSGHIGLGAGDTPEATNCASFQLRDSQGNGIAIANVGVAQCVPLTLPTLPTTTGGTAPDCGVDVLFVVDQSGSMRFNDRIAQVRAGVQMAQNAFAGNGSNGGLIVFNQQSYLAVPLPDPLPSGAIANAMASLPAFGGTRWDRAFALTRNVVTAAAEKPLVLFVTDGVPNEPWQNSVGLVNDIRAQGSRIIGVAIGNNAVTQNLTALLGGNMANTAAGAIPDPFTDDVVVIPNGVNMAAVFAQMAQAYCPQKAAQGIGDIIDLRLPAVPYAGDDEPERPAPTPPTLEITKRATGPCRVDEARRQYHCSFRIDVRNAGSTPTAGPLVVVERPGTRPAPVAVRASGGGWECDRQRGGEITCAAPGLSLAPGAVAGFDLRVSLPGLPDGGQWQNCASTGLPQGKRARVALAQRLMNARGLDAGPVDGAPGPRTYGALSRLRAQLGLPDSRTFDDGLFGALGIAAGGPRDCAQVALEAMPEPEPAPQLRCDPATTRPDNGACACSDPDRMVRRSATQCACKNGLPAINGKCVSVELPGTGAEGDSCKLRVNGICLSR